MMKTSEARRLWLPAGVAFAAPAADRQDLVLDLRLVAIQAERDDERDLLLEDEVDALERANRAPKDLARPPKAAKTTPSGLTYRALRQGKRAVAPVTAETVSLTFKAWSQNGRLFARGSVGAATWGHDANNGAPLALLIPGLAEGIRLMPPDSEYRFWISARLAWAEQPRAAEVPAGPIVVDVRMDRQ
jgi:FKBP-type peptidyl-prolyl cis-trans isomerase